jgi:hypothetical protein
VLTQSDTASLACLYDCETCGACCASPWDHEGYVRLNDDDLQRLGALNLPIILQPQQGDDAGAVIPRLGTAISEGRRVCEAFAGCIGVRCGCSIYSDRPQACRQLAPAGPFCKAARQRLGLPVS